jgi:adenylate cyclase
VSGTGLKQRLAAILAADVAGYSRLMAADERATVAALDAARAVFRKQIESSQSRVIDMAGDSVLAVFETATGAVSAALSIQNEINSSGQGQEQGRRMRFRIGVHLGDVIEKADGTIYGDGVNIAARLEGLAEPGGITISDAVRGAVRGKVVAGFVDQGEQQVKNIAHPVRAFAVRAEGSTAAKPSSAVGEIDLSLPDKPSIAVLPFANMSGDPEQEYFTDGVTEDIITELSRFHSLFVIARNSTFTYKGKAVDVRTVAKELGVRYVVEGSIRRAANRIRVTAQLVNASTGNHLWAERYDRVLEDIFEVQEEVTRSIVAAIAPQVDAAELATVSRRQPGNLTAYEIAVWAWANARDAMNGQDRKLRDQAIREANRALAIDPKSVLAHNAIAYAQWQQFHFRTAADRERAWKDGMDAATQAIELDASDHRGHMLKSRLLASLGGRWDEALNASRRACELNPSDSVALSVHALHEIHCGNAEQGIQHALHSLRANPRNPWVFNVHLLLAYACFIGKDYAKGVDWALLALGGAPSLPNALQHLATCYVGIGEIEKAKTALEQLGRIAPEFLESRLKGESIFQRPEDRERQTVFLRVAAGLEDPKAAESLR